MTPIRCTHGRDGNTKNLAMAANEGLANLMCSGDPEGSPQDAHGTKVPQRMGCNGVWDYLKQPLILGEWTRARKDIMNPDVLREDTQECSLQCGLVQSTIPQSKVSTKTIYHNSWGRRGRCCTFGDQRHRTTMYYSHSYSRQDTRANDSKQQTEHFCGKGVLNGWRQTPTQ